MAPAERPHWLEERAGARPELANEVRSLLEAHDASEYPEAEQCIGAYHLERLLGHGGMGEVWLASRADGQFEQRVAIKLVRSGIDADRLLPRFRRERQLLARLNHPNIARLLDGGIARDGRPFLVMEYVYGKQLLDFCAHRHLDLRARLDLFRKLCSAVEYAHQNLIIHCDIKPGNVLVTADATPKLLDFGVAKLLEDDAGAATTMALLTPRYTSPEQIRGEPVTTSTDAYALGVVLFELLTGALPYQVSGSNTAEIMSAITSQEPRRASEIESDGLRPASPVDLDAILAEALEKAPGRRYSSVESLSADLANYLAGRPVNARALTPGYRFRKYVRRHWRGIGVATAVVLGLGVATGLSFHSAQIADRQRARAERIAEYLEQVLASADPNVRNTGFEGGRQVKLVDVMQGASLRIATAFRNDFDIQAELHRIFAMTYINLGMFPEGRQELDEAQRHIDALRSNPAERALLEFSSGMLDYCQQHLDEAERKLRESLAAFSRTEKAQREPNRYAIGLNNLAMVLSARAKNQEAEQTLRNAVAVLGKSADAQPAEIAVTENNLGLFDLLNGRLERAQAELYSAIDRFQHIPEPPIQLSAAEANLSFIERLLGHPQAARAALERARDVVLRTAGPGHPNFRAIQIELAYQRGLDGDPPGAEAELRNFLQQTGTPERSVERPRVLLALGHVLTLAGKPMEGEPLLRELLKLRLQAAKRDYRIADVEFALAECLERQRRMEEARQMYQASLQDFRDHVGANVWATKQAEICLSRLPER